jgi:soluble lytic murein transglycosylase-like protein
MDKPSLITLARQKAAKYELDGDLVCAIVEQESGWDACAVRYEPAFMDRYILPLFNKGRMTPTEAYTRSMSWGLMQVMGEVAREHEFDRSSLAWLCDPEVGLDIGCMIFAVRLASAHNDVSAALLAWNGGANPNYPAEVQARMATYKALPPQTQVDG